MLFGLFEVAGELVCGGNVLLIRNNTGINRFYIFLVLVGILLVLTAQACGDNEEELLTTPSDQPVETAVPTVINTQEPTVVAEPTATPSSELTLTVLTPTVEVSPTVTSTPLPVLTISVQDVKQKLDSGQGFLLLDVRVASSYIISHIEGAVSMPLSKLGERYNEIPQDLEVIIYASCA